VVSKDRSIEAKAPKVEGQKQQPVPSGIDPAVLRIARRLAAIQRVQPGRVVVPYPVAVACRELASVRTVARQVLQGDPQARERLIVLVGGDGKPAPGRRLESRPLGPRATVVLGLAQHGPIHGLLCRDHVWGHLEVLQAAFKVDAEQGHRDGRLTSRAARFVRERKERLQDFERRLQGRLERSQQVQLEPVADESRGRSHRSGRLPPGGSLPADGPPDSLGAGRGGGPRTLPGQDYYPPLFPPGTEVPPLPDPPEPDTDPDFCLDLNDLCIDLFHDFALASLAEQDSQLIATVDPDCLCVGELTDDTPFTARPDARAAFPAQRGDYLLFFRGQDITGRITHWSTEEIRFTIPAGSSTGYVELYRFLNTMSAGLGKTLSHVCGIPDFGLPGTPLSRSPRALITIVHPPVIESFTVNGSDRSPVLTEACTAARLDWAVRQEDDAAVGLLLPPCARILVKVVDGQGNQLHQSNDPVGTWYHNAADNIVYRIQAISAAGKMACGRAESNQIEVRREHRLALETAEPSIPAIVAGKAGTLMVRLSCPAPAAGAQVDLQSSDMNVLRVPAHVSVLPGERAAPVQFGTSRQHHGGVTITAHLRNHRDAQLDYEVLENLTAIVLSGGGAKGSFEVGALLYLREVWGEIQPRIICGTSIGAINALALAEARDSRGVDKMERIWLELQVDEDMFVPSQEAQRITEITGVSVPDLVLHGGTFAGPGEVLSAIALSNVPRAAGFAAAGWAIGGPLGAFAAGLGGFLSGADNELADAVAQAERAAYLLSLQPTQDKIADVVDRDGIAHSGMLLRLATVALEDGGLYYVTEASRLIRDRAFNAPFDEPILDGDPLILGAMASAAYPGFFEARRITTPSTSYTHVDGGVREILPARAAVELGAQLLFNISASPLDPGLFTLGDDWLLLQIAKRSVDLQGNEVTLDDRAPRGGFCDQRERVVIHPAFEVHDTAQIDPGLIRINMAYGYFRAFDADQLRRGLINIIQHALWNLWTDDLIQERLACHQLEINQDMERARLGYYGGIFNHNTLQEIRRRKNRIAELIVGRFEGFGAEAFPRRLSSNVVGDQSVLDWCATWEFHRPDQRAFLNTVDLWQAQDVAPGVALEDGGGVPPTTEPEVLPRFPLPQEVLDGLRLR
jgi:NTE family protein